MNAAEPEAVRLGLRPGSSRRIHGGDTARVVRMDSDHGPVAVKLLTEPMPGMMRAEAAGLQWLARAGMRVPEVLAVDEDRLVVRWIETVAPTPAAAEAFGASLAWLHTVPAHGFGAAPQADDGWRPAAGWVGSVPLQFGHWRDWPRYYARARLVPVADLARGRGRLPQSARAAVEELCGLLEHGTLDVGPDPGPRCIHGDLWSGNILWQSDGAAVIDPSAHGGHPEADLAMLALFGVPYFDDLIAGYRRVRPLAEGWRQRLALHQIFPLLVHAAMFGGGYGDRVRICARAFLGDRPGPVSRP